jgi:hypothetical protein
MVREHQTSGMQLHPGESRDSPMRNCASGVPCFASPRNDGSNMAYSRFPIPFYMIFII